MRRLLLAAVCTVAQLLLIGFVLEWVFRVERWYVVLAMMVIMTLVAGVAAVQRTHFRYPGIWVRSVTSVWVGSWMIAALALAVIVRVRPWYTPQYAIPLLGMILGNTLNGVSLGLDRLGSELGGRRHQVEALLRSEPLARRLRVPPCARGADRAHPNHQRDDGRRDREPTGHDDRTDPRRGRFAQLPAIIRTRTTSSWTRP